MNKYVERLYNGIIKENPTFVLMLGMCPTLAVTSIPRIFSIFRSAAKPSIRAIGVS